MKIIHTASGKAYQLKADTVLEVERPNLFFNEYGEQTLPVELPDTDQNRTLTGYPDMVANNKKPEAKIDCTIQDGDFFMPCRQAILGAQRKEKISTAFYMNEGSFLSRISDVSLADLFGDETIPGVTTVAEGIDFCRSLVTGTNANFAIFPVLIDSGETLDNNYPKYKFINRWGQYNTNTPPRWIDGIGTGNDFFNAVDREETVDDATIKLSAGFYISPFVRANYLLTRIFQYFGYTIAPNFFTQTSTFADMVFVNNCADSLVNGTIRLMDLLPNVDCSDILNVFRKKFCCEFIPDETNKTVSIKLFNELIESDPQLDITKYASSHPEISFPEEYKRITVDSEDKLSDDASVDESDSMLALQTKYKNFGFDKIEGTLVRGGYQFTNTFITEPVIKTVTDVVAYSSMKYSAGDGTKVQEITVPDISLEFRKVYGTRDDSSVQEWSYGRFLYVGAARFLNSAIVESTAVDAEDTSTSTATNNEEMKPMLAFYYNDVDNPVGTISNYVVNHTGTVNPLDPSTYYIRISDYTLSYNGVDGIFERFYRKLDELYRNSLHTVKVNILQSSVIRQSINAHLPVSLHSQKLLINLFKYQVGGAAVNESEIELLSMRLYTPVETAPAFATYIDPETYTWRAYSSYRSLTQAEYESSPYKDKTFETIYYPQGGPEYLNKHNFEAKTAIVNPWNSSSYMEMTFWLECFAV